jgi:hypothetical protein
MASDYQTARSIDQDDLTVKSGKSRKYSPTLAAKTLLSTFKLAMDKYSNDIYMFDGKIFRKNGKSNGGGAPRCKHRGIQASGHARRRRWFS